VTLGFGEIRLGPHSALAAEIITLD
jgi:hypothetical protein